MREDENVGWKHRSGIAREDCIDGNNDLRNI